jgi:hypothetical protein
MSEKITVPISRHIILNDNVKHNESSLDKNIFENSKTFYNILIQSLISIGTFHNLAGSVFICSHIRKFLYVKNFEHNANGTARYYKYILDGKIYYLESCEYNVIISDFEGSKNINLLTFNYLKHKILREIENIPGRSIEAIAFDKVYYNMENSDEKRKLSINWIFVEFEKVKNGIYRLDILLNDYVFFLNDMINSYNIETKFPILIYLTDLHILHNKIKGKIENLRELVENKEISVESVIDLLQQAKNIFKEILDICVEQFPDIFLTQESFNTDETRKILNDIPFELYREKKIEDMGVCNFNL